MKSILILLIFSLIHCSSQARQIKFDDVKELKNRSEQIRARAFSKIIRELKKKSKPTYAEALLTGYVYRRLKNYKEAIRWYARAVYHSSSKLPKSYSSKAVLDYLDSSSRKSPMANEALYFAAQSYFDMTHINDPKLMLAKIKNPDEPLKEKILLLRAKIDAKEGDEKIAITAYENLVSKFPKVTYFLRLGYLNEKADDNKKALASYLKILEYPKIDWSYISGSRKIRKIVRENNFSLAHFSEAEKVRFAEGLRMTGHRNDSLSLWRSIKFNKLSAQLKFFYLQNYLRTLVNLQKYTEAQALYNKLKKQFEKKEQLAIFEDLTRRLLKRGRNSQLVQMIPRNFEHSDIAYYRLNALSRLKHTSAQSEILTYLQLHRDRARYVESMAFKRCLLPMLKKQLGTAQDCLMRLRNATKGIEQGGRSRYYLARIWQKQGKFKKAMQMYKEVYLNSPASSYAMKSLDNLQSTGGNVPSGSQEKIRAWIAENASSDKQMSRFFTKKIGYKKFAVDAFWQRWENKLNELENQLSQPELKATLFLAMGMTKFANDYLRNLDEYKGLKYTNEKDALLRQKVGIVVGDSHMKYYNMKRYLRIHRFQPDVYFLNTLAAECLYPTPYLKEVNRQARANGVEVASIYALMRQESQYHTGATSRSNAKGLLQLLPSTAVWLNKKMKVPGLNLYNPRHNIMLGTKFFSDLNRQFNNDFDKSAAAYNGGPGRVGRWLRSIPFDELELFFEQIPYAETYYYQKITRANYDRYRILINHKQIKI